VYCDFVIRLINNSISFGIMILCRYQHDMAPYACCYCGVTKQTQKQIVEVPFNNYGWLSYQSSKMVAIITKTRKFGPRNKIKSCNGSIATKIWGKWYN
jgi:hypothetical protein